MKSAKDDDIVAYTFAELAFMLMYAIFASYFLVEGISKDKIKALESELDSARSEIVVNRREYDELKSKAVLKSKATPNCIEKGVERVGGGIGILFEVTILNRSTYREGDVDYDFAGIINKYKKDIDKALECDCRHSINIKHGPNINLDDYIAAKNRLIQYFYHTDK